MDDSALDFIFDEAEDKKRADNVAALQSQNALLAAAVVALEGYVKKLANPKLQTALSESAAQIALEKHAEAITIAKGLVG